MTEQGRKFLTDMLNAIELIEEFTNSIDNFIDYTKDAKTQSAVERQLSIIGEAVNKYDKLKLIPLQSTRKIVGFRNRLIHAYDAVDSAMVWAIIHRHIKPLKNEVMSKIKLPN